MKKQQYIFLKYLQICVAYFKISYIQKKRAYLYSFVDGFLCCSHQSNFRNLEEKEDKRKKDSLQINKAIVEKLRNKEKSVKERERGMYTQKRERRRERKKKIAESKGNQTRRKASKKWTETLQTAGLTIVILDAGNAVLNNIA